MTGIQRVLCVDDHADTCDLITEILKDYEVISALSRSEGLRRARSQRFELILLDYHFRDGNGLDLCRQIREFNPITPILIVTGINTMTQTEVLEVGAQGLVKKIDMAVALPAAVHRVLLR